MSNQKSSRESHADTIIRNHVVWSMGAGLIPVLIADIFAVSALQLDMIRQLSRVYDIDFQETQGKAIVTALTSTTLARIGAGSVIKLIPGVGSLVGGATVSVFAGASTYALGEVFKKHFESGGTILDFDPDRLRKHYKEKFEKGKKMAREMKEKAEADNTSESHDGNFNIPSDPAQENEIKEEVTEAVQETIEEITFDKPMPDPTASIIGKLKELGDLKEAGVISDEEFEEMKKRLIDKF